MTRFDPAIRRQSGSGEADRDLAELATRQHGVVNRRQLGELGLSPSAIDRRVACGRLIALHRGVYAVGHRAITARGWQLAAILACGPGALLSHFSAGVLHTIARWSGVPHVTTRRRHGVRRGIVIHTTRHLHESDATVLDGIPVTSWARTVVDLATMMSVAQLCRVLEASAIARVYDDTELRAAIGRSPRRGGTRALREALALGHHLSPQQTRSMLEERFLTLVRESEPPIELPRLNSWIALPDGSGVEVDALWTSGLAIELDGERYHQHAGARARDASKQEALTALGYRVMRLNWRDVTATPVITLARVRRAIR